MADAIILLISVQDVPSLYLGWDTVYPTGFSVFLLSIQFNSVILH